MVHISDNIAGEREAMSEYKYRPTPSESGQADNSVPCWLPVSLARKGLFPAMYLSPGRVRFEFRVGEALIDYLLVPVYCHNEPSGGLRGQRISKAPGDAPIFELLTEIWPPQQKSNGAGIHRSTVAE